MAGYSGRSVVQKLGIKPGFRIFVDRAPAAYSDIVGALPDEVTIVSRPKLPLDVVHVFATDAAGLEGRLRKYRDLIAPDGMIWVSWPKKASKVPTDITEDTIRELALPLGFVDIKVCAVDETWSGLKLVVRKELR